MIKMMKRCVLHLSKRSIFRIDFFWSVEVGAQHFNSATAPLSNATSPRHDGFFLIQCWLCGLWRFEAL
eukprot:COSAG02_NODE_442_length_22243_cov_20.572887_6_plen_68_part_00